MEMQTEEGQCVTPSQNPLVAGFIPKQTRYGQAFAATMHFAPWDANTDSLQVFDEESFFGGLLKSWDFMPLMKMYCSDFRVVAFKPSGWRDVID